VRLARRRRLRWSCSSCNLAFHTKVEVVKHLASHRTRVSQTCDHCGLKLATKRELKVHRRTHRAEPLHLCSLCEESFKTKKEMQKHVRKHTTILMHDCDHCDKHFTSKQALRVHLASHRQAERLRTSLQARLMKMRLCVFTCPAADCGDAFRTMGGRKAHMKANHVQYQIHRVKAFKRSHQKVSCEVAQCDRQFWKAGHLEDHMRKEHGHPRVVCEVAGCGFLSSTRQGLVRHNTVHRLERKDNIVENKRYDCFQCNQAFTRPASLRMHVMTVHMKMQPYLCTWPDCHKRFGVKSNLRHHMEHVHRKEKRTPHICLEPKCGVMFERLRDLQNHTRKKHAGTKLQCPECPATFNSTSSLQRHMGVYHGEDNKGDIYVKKVAKKTLGCGDCDKMFSGPAGLKYHRRKEHGEEATVTAKVRAKKIIPCGDCEKMFAGQVGLRYHRKKEHGVVSVQAWNLVGDELLNGGAGVRDQVARRFKVEVKNEVQDTFFCTIDLPYGVDHVAD